MNLVLEMESEVTEMFSWPRETNLEFGRDNASKNRTVAGTKSDSYWHKNGQNSWKKKSNYTK